MSLTRPGVPWVLLLVVAFSAAACWGADPEPSVTGPSVSPSEPSASPTVPTMLRATLGLHLFSNGEIIEVEDGDERVLARWPSRIAPFAPPIETPHGFVGLSRGRRQGGRREIDLWLIGDGRRTRIDRDVAQSFAVSARAAKVAYGLPRYRSGDYRTRLVVATLPEGGRLYSVRIENYAAPIGFIGDRVLISAGDAVGGVSLWDPATGEMRPFHRYGTAGSTDATTRRALLYQGDGQCWDIGTLADLFGRVRGRTCSLSNPAFSPQGRWIAGIRGRELGAHNRLRVFDVFEAGHYFRSVYIPGALQPAWESDAATLVLARFGDRGDRGYAVYRCRVARSKRQCAVVWSTALGGRYSAWLVPRSTGPIEVARDEGNGFAMWPEHRGVDAPRTCVAPDAWRTDARTTAEEFGRRVLGWAEARAEIDRYEHYGVHLLLHRSDGPLIQIWLKPVASDCWSVTGVSRAPDRRRVEGASVSVRGRRVSVSVLRLGADTADVIVGFNGREVRKRVAGRSGATLRLDFKPRGSGYFIVLLKDDDGRVFSAAGTLLYPGLVAG